MHIYEKDRMSVPSVTTILHAVNLNPGPLIIWANRLGFRHRKYEDELNHSAEIGNIVHDAMDVRMRGEKELLLPNISPAERITLNVIFTNVDKLVQE